MQEFTLPWSCAIRQTVPNTTAAIFLMSAVLVFYFRLPERPLQYGIPLRRQKSPLVMVTDRSDGISSSVAKDARWTSCINNLYNRANKTLRFSKRRIIVNGKKGFAQLSDTAKWGTFGDGMQFIQNKPGESRGSSMSVLPTTPFFKGKRKTKYTSASLASPRQESRLLHLETFMWPIAMQTPSWNTSHCQYNRHLMRVRKTGYGDKNFMWKYPLNYAGKNW